MHEEESSLIFHKGFILLLITIGIGFAAINTGSNIQWFIFSLILGIVLSSKIISYFNLINLKATVGDIPELFANESSYIPIAISNKGKFFSAKYVWVELVFSKNNDSNRVYISKIGKDEEKLILYQTKFPMRGEYEIKEIKIMSAFPMDFFKNIKRIKAFNKFLVYPEIFSYRQVPEYHFLYEGLKSSVNIQKGAEIKGLSPYTGIEPFKYIHWKITAKKDELWVKQFSMDESRKITIILDWQFIKPLLREKAISLAASLAIFFDDNFMSWRLISNNFDSEFGQGKGHLKKCLDYLARLEEFPPTKLNIQNTFSIKISNFVEKI